MLRRGFSLFLAITMLFLTIPFTTVAAVTTDDREGITIAQDQTGEFTIQVSLENTTFKSLAAPSGGIAAVDWASVENEYFKITAARKDLFSGKNSGLLYLTVTGKKAVDNYPVEFIVPTKSNNSGKDASAGILYVTVNEEDSTGEEGLKPESITLSPATLELEVEETADLEVIASPSDASLPTVTWSSSDQIVADVDHYGTVTAISDGTAKITATAGGRSAFCMVTVTGGELINDKAVTGVSLDKKTAQLLTGQNIKLIAAVLPEDAGDRTVEWESSDPAVAMVTDGVVTGVGTGTAQIQVKTRDGDFTDCCQVTVAEAVDGTLVIEFPKKGKLADLLKAEGFDPANSEMASQLKHLIILPGGDLESKVEFASSDMKTIQSFVNLESFVMGEGLIGFKDNTLPNGAFQTLQKLEVVVLPDVKVIGARAFGHVKGTAGSLETNACIALREAVFGEVRSIGCGAFYGCRSLESITFNQISIPPILEDDAEYPEQHAYWFDLVPSGMTLYVPSRAISAFLHDDADMEEETEWDRFCIESNGDDGDENEEDAGTKTVIIADLGGKRLSAHKAITDYYGSGKEAYSSIGYLTIEAGVINASDFSFIKNNLTGLKELRIIGTTTLPSAAFDDYSQVPDMEAADAAQLAKANAKLYNNVIPSNAFGMMKFLEYVEITNAEVVGKQAFQKAENLEMIVLPNVVRVNSMAFAMVKGSDKSQLDTIILPKLAYMEHRTFYFNVNLKNLELGEKAPFVYRPQGKEGLWFSFVPGPVTITVEDRDAYDDFMLEENCALIDWSSFDFEAKDGSELPKVGKAAPYVDSDLDYLREQWQTNEEYYTGDIGISLNFYTFNVNLNAWRDGKGSPPPISTLDVMRWAKKAGFDAVDITAYYIPGYSNTAMPTEEQKEQITDYARQIRDLSEELDLPLSGTGIQNNFADPSQKRRELDIKRVKYWIDIADEMGAPCIRVFSGTPPADVSRNGWYKIVDERIVPALQEVADYAAEYHPDVIIGLQNHGDMLATANQVLYVLDQVDRDNVQIVNDTGYYHDFMDLNTASIESYDWYSDIAQILPYTANFQLKKKPAGAGTGPVMNLERIFTDIRNSSYRGYVPVELLWVSTEAGYPNYLSTPPYAETEDFLKKVRTAVEKTRNTSPRCDVLEVNVPPKAVINQDGLKITATVAKTMTQVTPYIQVSQNAQWKLYEDSLCTSEIGVLNLNQLVNQAYIKVTAQNGNTKVYLLEVNASGGAGENTESHNATAVLVTADRSSIFYNTSDNKTVVQAEVTPKEADEYTIVWETSDAAVASVSGNGIYAEVIGKNTGTAAITAIVINKDGSVVKGSVKLQVKKYVADAGDKDDTQGSDSSGNSGSSGSVVFGNTVSPVSGQPGSWVQDSFGWWFRYQDGSYPVSAWLLNNGKWYYFDEKGYMKTGWVLYKELWYYLGADGDMLVDMITPDGYRVDKEGVWIP